MNAARRAQGDPRRSGRRMGARSSSEPGDPAYVLTPLRRRAGAGAGRVRLHRRLRRSAWCVPAVGLVRAPLFDGLFGAIFGYVLSCAIVLVLGILIDLVAPLFGGRRDFDSAFKLAVYSFTPVWLAGIFLVLPGLRFLDAHRLLRRVYSVARPAAPDQIARATLARLRRVDCHLRFCARLFRRHDATHGVRHAGLVSGYRRHHDLFACLQAGRRASAPVAASPALSAAPGAASIP